jgi:hypothetical protein
LLHTFSFFMEVWLDNPLFGLVGIENSRSFESPVTGTGLLISSTFSSRLLNSSGLVLYALIKTIKIYIESSKNQNSFKFKPTFAIWRSYQHTLHSEDFSVNVPFLQLLHRCCIVCLINANIGVRTFDGKF